MIPYGKLFRELFCLEEIIGLWKDIWKLLKGIIGTADSNLFVFLILKLGRFVEWKQKEF